MRTLEEINKHFENKRKLEEVLLTNIQNYKEDILKLYEDMNGWWGGEDRIYRFYHESYKVYHIKEWNLKAIELMKNLLDVPLNKYIERMIEETKDKEFDRNYSDWYETTKPMVDTFLHLEHIIKLMIKYGLEADNRQREGNSGWFTVLYVYNLR